MRSLMTEGAQRRSVDSSCTHAADNKLNLSAYSNLAKLFLDGESTDRHGELSRDTISSEHRHRVFVEVPSTLTRAPRFSGGNLQYKF